MGIINADGPDNQAKVSKNDKKTGYLEDKIIAGTGVTITKVAVAGVEHLVVEATDADTSGLHYVECKIVNGCVMLMKAGLLVDYTECFIKEVAC